MNKICNSNVVILLLAVVWIAIGPSSCTSLKRLEKRLRRLENKVHDDVMSFRADFDDVFDQLNAVSITSVNETQDSGDDVAPNAGDCDATCPTASGVDRATMDNIMYAQRGFAQEKNWLRANMKQIDSDLARFSNELKDEIGDIGHSLEIVKQEMVDICRPAENQIASLSEAFTEIQRNVQTDNGALLDLVKTVELLSADKGTLLDLVKTVELLSADKGTLLDLLKTVELLSADKGTLLDLVKTVELLSADKGTLLDLVKTVELLSAKTTTDHGIIDTLVAASNERQAQVDTLLVYHRKTIQKKKMNGVIAWFEWEGSTYYWYEVPSNWDDASTHCIRLGGYLAEMGDEQEQEFMVRMLGNSRTWIGGSDLYNEGVWKWSHSKQPVTDFWSKGEPNGGRTENCLEMQITVTYPDLSTTSVKWNDNSCSKKFRYLCEFDTPLK